MKTERDTTTTQETFTPKKPNPSAWNIVSPHFSLSPADHFYMLLVVAFLVLTTLISAIFFIATHETWASPSIGTTNPSGEQETQGEQSNVTPPSVSVGAFADGATGNVLYGTSDNFKTINANDMVAKYAAIADVSAGKLIAGLGEDTKIFPASLTKVMTLIVVVEHIKDEAALQNKITVSQAVFDAMYKAGASGQGFEANEQLTVEAMLYALMLKSDGIAACELAKYIAGSEAAFVALMNQKATEMGLNGTHFTNPTGLHDENHYSTCRDLATIMGYAMNMSLCRKIMTEDAIEVPCISPSVGTYNHQIYNNLMVTYFNMNKSLTPGKAGSLTIIAGKTGFTPESQYCLVTCAQGTDGKYYVCVTADSPSGAVDYDKNYYKNCITSYQSLYSKYVG